MRKLLSSLAFLFATIPIFAQFSGSGSGTANDPYLIYNEIQLAQMANFLGQEGVVFKLQKDLDVSNYISENYPTQGWLPIGTSSSPFKGTFNGNGHTISGLFINRSSTDYVGLFGYIQGATIQNLNINATYIKAIIMLGQSQDIANTLVPPSKVAFPVVLLSSLNLRVLLGIRM